MSNDIIPAWIIGRRSVYVEGIVAALAQSKFLISNFFSSYDDNEADCLRTDEKILCLITAEKTAVSLGYVDLIAKRVREKRPNALIVLVSSTPNRDAPLGDYANGNFFSFENDCFSIDAWIAGDLTGDELVSLLQMILNNSLSIQLYVQSRDRAFSPIKTTFSLETDRVVPFEVDQGADDKSNKSIIDLKIHNKFSSRERQILQGISDGDTNKVLARKLNISEATVKAHVRTVFRKLGAHNRTQAVRYYFSHQSDPQTTLTRPSSLGDRFGPFT